MKPLMIILLALTLFSCKKTRKGCYQCTDYVNAFNAWQPQGSRDTCLSADSLDAYLARQNWAPTKFKTECR